MIVCVCHRISEKDIHAAVSNGASCFSSLQDGTGVATQCGRCRECAQDVLNQALNPLAASGAGRCHGPARNSGLALQAA